MAHALGHENPALIQIESCLDFDPNPRECYGFLVYLEIGITTTRFQDDAPTQHSLYVFTRGAYDDLLHKSTAPDLDRHGYLQSRKGG